MQPERRDFGHAALLYKIPPIRGQFIALTKVVKVNTMKSYNINEAMSAK